jgi:signal transduction histidine kinase
MFSKGSTLSSRSLVALIVGIAVVPLTTLLWLGWRLLEQDRALEQQQVRQRVERGADLIVSALQRAVSVSEQRLVSTNGQWPDGAAAVTFRDGQIEAFPRERIAYLPVVQPLPEAPAATFVAGEDLEFRRQDRAAAINVFNELTRSGNSAIRAGALLRLGRNLHNAGRFEEALTAYVRLSEMDDVAIGGVPAGLIGRYARCRLLEEHRRWADLRAEALGLQRELWSGRWRLTGPVYSLYAMDVAKWTGNESAGPRQPEVFAEAVSVLWDKWMSSLAPRASSGRESLAVNHQTLAVLWQNSGGSFRALVAAPAFVESQWLTALAPIAEEQMISFGLRDADGARIFGTIGTNAPNTVRSAAESALPWSVVTASLDPPVERQDFARRRQWLGAGFVLLVSMALVACYVIVRAVNREIAVARLQSDFVAAVSHEFRTPPTALRQFTDMLREHPLLDDDRRRTAYDAQSRATDRLTRLVESLLDFGRMEAGARGYRFEQRDCTELVRQVVDDFRAETRAAAYDIEFHGNGSAPIDTDDEALARAVWNLLDNAVKYSPKPSHVEVGLHNRDGHVFIAVRDHGIGIPAHEHAQVFSKFYRGEQARTRGIRGTGIGLTMVDEIVKAHRGRIEVESEPGKGSTFTIVLPAKS